MGYSFTDQTLSNPDLHNTVNGVVGFQGPAQNSGSQYRDGLVSDPTGVLGTALVRNFNTADRPEEVTLDAQGRVTAFAAPFRNGGHQGYAIGTASVAQSGMDPETGLVWGRWAGGVATVSGQSLDLGRPSLHYVFSGQQNGPVSLPLTGTANYNLIGSTAPTDNVGNVGTLNTASLAANFTQRTVDLGVNLSITGRTINAAAVNVPIFREQYFTAFAGNVPAGLPIPQLLNITCQPSCAGAAGSVDGFFAGRGGQGAGMMYNLNGVTGAAAFRRAGGARPRSTDPMPTRRRILFSWEVGENRGHVQPYLGLLSAMAENGWDIALALRNTSVVDRAIRNRWPVFQAPVCVNEFTGISSTPANHTEIYLGFGYAHQETLAGLVAGWRAIIDSWRPGLVLANYAPTSQLAARAMGIPCVRIGTGFECPPPGSRSPLLQAWSPGIEARLERAETLALRNANGVLKEWGAAPCESLSAVLNEAPTLVATVPEFDEFPGRAGPHEYLGSLAKASSGGLDPGRDFDLFAYLRVAHPRTAETMAAIAALGRPAFVHMPDATEAQCLGWTGRDLVVSREPADISRVLPRVQAVVCYASHGMALDSLLAGKPLLLLPTHSEQQRTARRVAALGAGLVIGTHDPKGKVAAGLRQVLEDRPMRDAARDFASRQMAGGSVSATDRAAAVCEDAVFQSSARLKVVHP